MIDTETYIEISDRIREIELRIDYNNQKRTKYYDSLAEKNRQMLVIIDSLESILDRQERVQSAIENLTEEIEQLYVNVQRGRQISKAEILAKDFRKRKYLEKLNTKYYDYEKKYFLTDSFKEALQRGIDELENEIQQIEIENIDYKEEVQSLMASIDYYEGDLF